MGTVTTPLLTAEEFEAQCAGDAHKRAELVRGEVHEMTPASWTHSQLCRRILLMVSAYAEAQALGECGEGQVGFRLRIPGRDGDTVLSPDVSFVRAERLDAIPEWRFVPFEPDLAVEVVAPSESAGSIAEKLAEYLAGGTRMVWIVYAGERSIAVHVPDAAPRYLKGTDVLDGGDVLPGLSIPVATVFHRIPRP